MKSFFCIVAAACVLQASLAMVVCPPNACDTMDCSSAQLEVASCNGRVDGNGGFCGCCPACIQQLNEGDACVSMLLGVPSKSECGQGLQCHPEQKVCVKADSTAPVPPCLAERSKNTLLSSMGMVGVHAPECQDDGYYAAVQCVEAVCSCVDKMGKQIENFQTEVGNRHQMNCQCARDKDALKLTALVFPKKCDEIGNYERVQCNGGMCYCVNDHGKKIEGFGTVEESHKEMLGGCLE